MTTSRSLLACGHQKFQTFTKYKEKKRNKRKEGRNERTWRTCAAGKSALVKMNSTAMEIIRQVTISPNLISMPNVLSETDERSLIRICRLDVRMTKEQQRYRNVSKEKAALSFLDARQSSLNVRWTVSILSRNAGLFSSTLISEELELSPGTQTSRWDQSTFWWNRPGCFLSSLALFWGMRSTGRCETQLTGNKCDANCTRCTLAL